MTTRTRMITAAAGLTVLLALPGMAVAQTDLTTDQARDQQTDQARDRRTDAPTVEGVKERALAAIDRRLETLDRLTEKVSSNEHVTPEHAATLLDDYAEATRGLGALAGDIGAATTLEELRELVPAIAEDYRVYLVIAPKSHQVVVSDTIVDVAARAVEAADELDELIARASEAGWDPKLLKEAEKAVDEMRRNIDRAEKTGGSVADKVIDLDASDWPEPAQEKLRKGHEHLQSARESLREAKANARTAIEALRNARPDDAPSAV